MQPNTDASRSLESALQDLPLLCDDRQRDLWQEWINTAAENATPTTQAPLITNPRRIISDANVRVQAAIDGQGLILADAMMINEINSEQLVRPYKQELEGYGYALLSAANRFQSPHAQTLKAWLSNVTSE